MPAAALPSKPAPAGQLELPRPIGALAAALLELAERVKPRTLLHVADSERRIEQLADLLRALDPTADVVAFPPWDSLPFDRVSPSAAIMGQRIAALRQLSRRAHGVRIVVTGVEALSQRVPPRSTWRDAFRTLRVGDAIDLPALRRFLQRTGYDADEHVNDPGEFAIRGRAVDIFVAGLPAPHRIEHEDGRITDIRTFDAVSQRSLSDVDRVEIGPASEVILPEDALPAEAALRDTEHGDEDGEWEWPAGIEHDLAAHYPALETLFDYVGDAALILEPATGQRRAALVELLREAQEGGGAEAAPRGRSLYLDRAAWDAALARLSVLHLTAPVERGARAVPLFVTQRNAGRAFRDFVRSAWEQGRRVVLADPPGTSRVSMRAARLLDEEPRPAADWHTALRSRERLLAMELSAPEGFRHDDLVVVTAADLLGSRAASPSARAAQDVFGDGGFHIGDVVVHTDQGVGVLDGLETVTAGEIAHDAIRLRYADDASLMVPVEDANRIWRYGSGVSTVRLDRLDGDAWLKRRGEAQAETEAAAQRLVALAQQRESAKAPVLVPPPALYERFGTRFPFDLTPDQAAAIEATLADLASGRAMDRLVCGDVGYGKTEVALRAAAAAVFSGMQVAVAAPTTVLVRQHLETFRRRFAGLDVAIEQLSRLVSPAEAHCAKKAMADGTARIVIGTHALAGKGVRFKELGLVIIDEEQRFGAAQKQALRNLARGVHVLTLTATPIPRTMQAAIVGVQDLSVIATPPARRQPIRTVLAPFDGGRVRQALRYERRRGGQSFVVCPRIEDIAPMTERLNALVPELKLTVAHGKMPAAEIDEAMVRFADGDGDILLATNIIESGLDVPRANTILVWRADRFGLAQLHQLRGRTGRGARRGFAYLLTEPGAKIAKATEQRLRTLETLDRLGSGFAISAQDLDLRGAGELMGEEQAGHINLIGADLYGFLLRRAVAAARGDPPKDTWTPDINLGAAGRIPETYVPEEEVRINLYARLARIEDDDAVDAFEDEIEDRFGPPPDEVDLLFILARIRQACRACGIVRLDAGPQAIAATFKEDRLRREAASRLANSASIAERGERLILSGETASDAERRARALGFLAQVRQALGDGAG